MKLIFKVLLFVAPFAFSGCFCPEKGMVLHCDFENAAEDVSGHGLNGILRGASISDDSVQGSHSVYFDGVDDYVEFPSGEVYFNGDYSISIWVKWNKCELWDRILDFNQDAPMSGNAVTFLVGAAEKGMKGTELWFDQWVQSGGNPVESIVDQFVRPGEASLGCPIRLGEWFHYVIVYDSESENPLGTVKNRKGLDVPYEGKVTFYLNGQKYSESYRCLKPQDVPTLCNWLGRSRFAADPYFNGWMDDFRIYDHCLKDKEIKTLYNNSKQH